MTDPEITFNANPTQKAFINSRAEADLFSSRKGEGKSTALCWACWYHTRNNPGAQWAIIRDTWTNLRRTTLAEFFRWFPAGVWGTWHEQNREFTWNPHLMGPGSRVTFLGLDDKTDAAKVASMPLGGVGLDEPCPAASEGLGIDDFVFTTAMGQLRQPGMRWYAAKIAQNNSDETHWTYRRFVDPGTGPHGGALLPLQEPGFRLWQPVYAENTANLKPGYYEAMRREWADRPDLVSRFVDGKITNQLIGRPVTPEWDDNVHLARELVPVRGTDLILCWDWGNTPACAITQLTPLGHWLILETHVGVDVGVYELITDQIKPALRDRYRRFKWWHTGDPSGARKEQSSVDQSAVRVVKKELGGVWRPGPQDPMDGVPALRSVMRSIGRVKVDRTRAKEAWWALRGGWHFHIARSGVAGGRPVKDVHSHIGDALAHGAAVVFPLGTLRERKAATPPKEASW